MPTQRPGHSRLGDADAHRRGTTVLPAIIFVSTGPRERHESGLGAAGIRERASEIAFNIAPRLELRSPAVTQRLLAELPDPPPAGSGLARLREARRHVIAGEDAFRALPSGSALDTRWEFLRRLRDLGRDTAKCWLSGHLANIGHRPTLDLAGFASPIVELRTACII